MGYICTLSNELQERARDELHEIPEKREENIEQIRNWIESQPHLNIRTDDEFILRFLRGCKFSLDKTKEKIDLHYSLKTAIPKWFKNRDPQDSKFRELLKLGIALPLKEPDNNGAKIFIFRQNSFDPKLHHINTVMKTIFLISDIFTEMDEVHQITGIGIIIDMNGITAQHITQYTPSVLKKALTLWQDGYVAKNRYWNFLHAGSVFQIAYKIAKIFMKEELKNMITLYDTNFDKMYKTVPKRILPREYGGEGESIQEIIDNWLQIIDSKRGWILQDEENTVIESKRPK